MRAGLSPMHGGFMGAILGLALVGCGDPDPGDEEGATTPSSTTNASGSTTGEGTASTTDPGNEAEGVDYGTAEPPAGTTGSSGTDSGSSTGEPGSEAEGADYGGPETGL